MWTDWSRDDFIAAFDANLLTPIALIKATLPDMMERGWGRIVNITSVAVKAPIPVLGLSNTARSGLTGYVAGVSRQVAGSGVTVNNLLPGLHDTTAYKCWIRSTPRRRALPRTPRARADCNHSRRALRHCRGIWCGLCLAMLG